MKARHFTIMIALFLLVPGMTSTAGVAATLSRTLFGVADPGQTGISGAWESEDIDCESAICLSCHDGVTASDSPIGRRPAHGKGLSSPGANHPIGVSYSRVSLRNQREYVPEAALDPAIRLVDGVVSCVSCHERKSGADTGAVGMDAPSSSSCTASKRLVLHNARSRLCAACHIK